MMHEIAVDCINVTEPSRGLVLATICCIEDATSSLALGTPRWVSPSLKRANVLTSIQPEGIILADLLLKNLHV